MVPDDSFSERRERLVRNLAISGYIRTPAVERAMRKILRELFVPDDLKEEAYIDSPLPIGHGQTISAPHMVAIMLEELMLSAGLKVLEIGGGSGYHAALTGELVRPNGKVFTIERIVELAEFARDNIEKAGYAGIVKVIHGDGSKGYPKEAPFDRIFVACGAPDIPKPLLEQLADDGVMLVPVGGRSVQDLLRITKKGGRIIKENRGGCIFVPLIGEHGYDESVN